MKTPASGKEISVAPGRQLTFNSLLWDMYGYMYSVFRTLHRASLGSECTPATTTTSTTYPLRIHRVAFAVFDGHTGEFILLFPAPSLQRRRPRQEDRQLWASSWAFGTLTNNAIGRQGPGLFPTHFPPSP